jgi:hypothetical protein
VTRALLDAQQVVPAHGHPGDPGRTQVVEGDVLLAVVVGEEVRPLHTRVR